MWNPVKIWLGISVLALAVATRPDVPNEAELQSQRAPHWAFIGPIRPPLPAVDDNRWPANPIDWFILARLEAEGLRPSPPADARTLMRRLSFDLIGLPPTPTDVAAFETDAASGNSDFAFEHLADRLLASPHFGERMTIAWLDLVRYADTVGYHGDQEHPISPYRDYVIHAFNSNMPFDRFTVEQLAGDLLPDATVDQKIASGYNRLLQTSHEGGVQQREYLAKYAADRVRNLSSVWLGMTMGCAECHNHKFDPFTARDFYRLEAFFADIDDLQSFKGGDTSPTKREPELEVLSPIDREQLDPPKPRRTMITVAIPPRVTCVLARGDWMDDSGEIVEPGVPAALGQIDSEIRATRLDLARWIVSKENPLAARVFVNRLWQMFFGKGLAARLDDFGTQGEPPVNPELLDWLAVEFMESGWDVKHMVKLIVTSRAYRQSSLESAELRRRDSANRLVARQSRWRLPAEMVRDNALAVSGLLVSTVGGPSVRPYQPDGYYDLLNFPKRSYKPDSGDAQHRRGLYAHWQRSFLHPMLKAFDAPSREECTVERPVSNTPAAALVLLNDPTFVEAARAFAARTLLEGGESTDDRLRWAWRTALSRDPLPRELAALRTLLDRELADLRANPAAAEPLLKSGLAPLPAEINSLELAAWTAVARTAFNLDEFLTRE